MVYVALRVPANPLRAFEAFTEEIALWWRPASFTPEQLTEVEVRFEGVGNETRISIEHRAWDTIPQKHVARHGFPEHVTLQRVADWWRASLTMLGNKLRE
jgi:hypothetical protein